MTARLRIRIVALTLTLTPLLSLAQQGYREGWKTVDSLIDKGQPQSALTKVNTLYQKARKANDEPQFLKALIYRLRLQENNREDADIQGIAELQKELPAMQGPSRSILLNLIASAYLNYYQQHRYQLYHRTNTNHPGKDSITSWTIDDFHKRIGQLYLASLEHQPMLTSVPLEIYDPILIKGNVRHLRPTLYDVLAHAALDYFSSDERDLSKPAYAFEIAAPEAFADAASFAKHRFKTADSISLHYKALTLFQQLIQLHLADAKPDALIDVDIQRLQFAKQYAVVDQKDSLYNAALARITSKWPTLPAAAEAWYLQAVLHLEKAAKYDPPQDTAGRYGYVAAKNICDKVIAQKDSSEGKIHCRQLLQEIGQRSLELQIETVNLPDQAFRTLVKWRNIHRLYMRIVRFDHATKESLGIDSYQDTWWQKLLQLPAVRTFAQALPPTDDYQTHRAEISIEGLPIGSYAVIASDDSSFRLGQHIMTLTDFHISNIAYINNDRDHFVLDRSNGKPLPAATIQEWSRRYDYKTRKQIFEKEAAYRSDEHGHFQISKKKPADNGNQQIALEISAGKDHLFIDEPYYADYASSDGGQGTASLGSKAYEASNLTTYLFTDRSIYRPGQTLHFKGIVITRDFNTRQPKIIKGLGTKVILYDVNGSKVDSIKVVTNDFGSYRGTFRLPENLLNGEFYLRDDSTGKQESFSIEEYRRPKFYISYDTIKDSYRVNDTIRIKGLAKAFAGNDIDGAAVSYTVKRQASRNCFDCLPYTRRFAPAYSTPQEIIHGTATTDANGAFTVSFAATPDHSIDRSQDPTFEFTISADVTDLNGETHNGTISVRAGYHSLELTIQQPATALAADSMRSILVKAANLNGTVVPATTEISVYSLKMPARLIRKRYWEQPDQFVLSREEYIRLFPHDEYSDETMMQRWEKNEKVWESTDSANKVLTIGKRLAPGAYVIEVRAVDKDGETVKEKSYVSLYESRTGAPADPQYVWKQGAGRTAQPGDKVTVSIGSSASDAYVIRKLSRSDTVFGYTYLNIDKGSRSAEFPVTAADRGGFAIEDVFVKDGRIYSQTFNVAVPWTNKQLSIGFDTYRDKLLPGSEEKWKVTIKGAKKDKVAAEILMGMYDASLDELKPHDWSIPSLYDNYSSSGGWEGERSNFGHRASRQHFYAEPGDYLVHKQYDQLESVSTSRNQLLMRRGRSDRMFKNAAAGAPDAAPMAALEAQSDASPDARFFTILSKGNVGAVDASAAPSPAPDAAVPSDTPPPTQIRKNFNETAFFFPDLRTDDSGSITFSFTMPEALTRWKWMTLAHTKDLAFGYDERSVITQKQLMIQPNAPRFLREGDRMELSAKIVNLTDSEMTGQAELQLIDATTGQTADGIFSNRQANQYFTAGKGQSAVVSFPLDIPYQYNRPLTYRIIARAKQYSDGEEAMLPVISNRMLVTESLPLNMQGDGSKDFRFEKLLSSAGSETLNHHAVTIEFTSNPAWYAVQALPYLMEYPYECAEQTFNRFYANALASHIANSSPKIKAIFEKWKTADTAALLSNLEKNQELKSMLLQETPWVLQGKTEAQQRQHIAMLFDMVRMSRELETSLQKLADMQTSNGGFVWFKGGADDRYITQYIMTGIGHLQKLDAIPANLSGKIKSMIATAIPYLDARIKQDYEDLMKNSKGAKPSPLASGKSQNPAGKNAAPADKKPASIYIGEFAAHYLYMRSFFNNHGIPGDVLPAVSYFRKQAQQGWLQTGRYTQGLIALALFRTGDVQTARNILTSLKQNAIRDDERGMYWKGMENGGYYWWQAPIEIQSLMIEAFQEVAKDASAVQSLRTWLLKQKQTHSWTTTKATADACYALLIGNDHWLNAEREITIRLGSTTLSGANASEAGTGYFKQVIGGPRIQPNMGNITVTVKTAAATSSPSWGAVYWQYFDNLDKITPTAQAKAPLQLTKKIYIEKNTDRGPVLEAVADNGVLHPGDKIKVRIELHSDRDMEYVHMKDMRAACMEPVNVISSYKWQGGLGYYESTKDASTDFFFSHIPRGSFVFEYPLFVAQQGNFSNGITSIECMYAPEFSYHSEGIRVNVEEVKP